MDAEKYCSMSVKHKILGYQYEVDYDEYEYSSGDEKLSDYLSRKRPNLFFRPNTTQGRNTEEESLLVKAHQDKTINERYVNLENLRIASSPSDDDYHLHCNADDAESDGMPILVDRHNQPAVEENRKVFINASEIVVGNIHPSFGAAYILHMFDEYVPLAASPVQVVPNTGRRYCYVYFRKEQDAADVERKFDGHALLGTKLVVLRPSNLMQLSLVYNQNK